MLAALLALALVGGISDYEQTGDVHGDRIGIQERYDMILVIDVIPPAPSTYTYRRIYFCRNGKIIARRYDSGQFTWTTNGRDFLLSFEDYGWPSVDRLIHTRGLVFMASDEDPEAQDANWWGARNIATDLEAPATED
jgi:hypothetical protein